MRTRLSLALLIMLASLLQPAVAAADPIASETTASGLQLRVEIEQPDDGATVPVPEVDIAGTASTVAGDDARVVAVMDLSLSTQFEGDQTTLESIDCNGDGRIDGADDANTDGLEGTTLDCEVLAIVGLFDQLSTQNDQAQAAVVGFGINDLIADLQPADGHQPLTGLRDDLDGDGSVDLDQVVRSAYAGVDDYIVGFDLFERYATESATNFERALHGANSVLADQKGGARIVYFLTDGEATHGFDPDTSPELALAAATGTTITTFSVGVDATGCEENGAQTDVGAIAQATGGECYETLDAADLPDIVAQGSSVTDLSFSLNGGPAQPIALEAQWEARVEGLVEGVNTIAVTAKAAGSTTATADIEVIYDPNGTVDPEPGGEYEPPPGVSGPLDGVAPEPVALGIGLCGLIGGEPDSVRQVLLARDDEFADAFAGAPLAGDDSCILYTAGGPDQPLDPATMQEIDRALPAGAPVRILGGSQAVSQLVADELAAAGFAVDRIAGETRIQTSIEIAERVLAEQPVVEGYEFAALLAFAYDWPDAITGGAFGAATGVPVLLTDRDGLDADTAAALQRLQRLSVSVLGGEAAVGPQVLQSVEQGGAVTSRYAGPNRMGTAVDVATRLWDGQDPSALDRYLLVNLGRFGDGPAGDGFDGWTAALAAAPLSAKLTAPQLGVYRDAYPAETEAYLREHATGGSEPPAVVLVGGVQVIDTSVRSGLEQTVGG